MNYGSVDKKQSHQPIEPPKPRSRQSIFLGLLLVAVTIFAEFRKLVIRSPFALGGGSSVGSRATLVVEDSYSRQGYPQIGLAYLSYADVDAIVEPFRATTLSLSTLSDCSAGSLLFEAESSRIFETDDACRAHNVSFESLGGPFTLRVLDRTSTEIWSGLILVKRARREIRSLSSDDRERFLDAAQAVYFTPTASGIRVYGDKFIGHDNLTAIHANQAAGLYCDGLHDGTGFLLQHAAFSLVFERSIQSVDPLVSLPYWDYTIEASLLESDSSLSFADVSPMFTDDW